MTEKKLLSSFVRKSEDLAESTECSEGTEPEPACADAGRVWGSRVFYQGRVRAPQQTWHAAQERTCAGGAIWYVLLAAGSRDAPSAGSAAYRVSGTTGRGNTSGIYRCVQATNFLIRFGLRCP